MRELRHGVKLKKVQEQEFNPLPTEFQLTPFEMLMQDIRARNYKLRKVMVSGAAVEVVASGTAAEGQPGHWAAHLEEGPRVPALCAGYWAVEHGLGRCGPNSHSSVSLRGQ